MSTINPNWHGWTEEVVQVPLKLKTRMTQEEAECFMAAQKWQHRANIRHLVSALRPKLPYYQRTKNLNKLAKGIYFLIVLVTLPFIILMYLVDILAALFFFPFRYISSRKISDDLKAPGEGNIQGIHNAFFSHFDLPLDYYVHCVNDWAHILYGKKNKNLNRMQDFLDFKQLNHINHFGSDSKADDLVQPHLRSAVNIAREQLSQKLGSYR